MNKGQCGMGGGVPVQQKPRTATRRAVELARRAGAIVSFDPNLRPALWRELDKGRSPSGAF